jgi:hypothetical protein
VKLKSYGAGRLPVAPHRLTAGEQQTKSHSQEQCKCEACAITDRPQAGEFATEKAIIMAATTKSLAATKNGPARSDIEQGPNIIAAEAQSNSTTDGRDQDAIAIQSSPTTGYKGHRPGSRKGVAHQLFDELGAIAARPLVLKLGLTKSTVKCWFAEFRKLAQPAQPPVSDGGGDA